MTPSLGDEGIRAETWRRSPKMTWSGELTSDLGVGVAELAANDDLIRLCPVKVTAGLVALAEEVADEALGALIQILEVGGELGVGVSAEMRRWSDADLKCGIGEKETRTERRRSAGRTFANTLVAGHRLGGREKGWGFFGRV